MSMKTKTEQLNLMLEVLRKSKISTRSKKLKKKDLDLIRVQPNDKATLNSRPTSTDLTIAFQNVLSLTFKDTLRMKRARSWTQFDNRWRMKS